MPDLDLDDIRLHYEVAGDGPPLLLLAGMMGDSASWAPLLPLLAERFTVICPDNRTTGRTVPRDAPVSLAQIGADAMALMDHLGHQRFSIAGHSMGGLVTLDLAALHGDRIERAAVLASGRVRSPRTAAVFDALLAVRRAPQGEEMWLRALYPWVFGAAFLSDPAAMEAAIAAARAYPHAQDADAMAHQLAALKSYRPAARVEDIPCPVLVLYAEEDVLIPPAAARPGFAAIPDLTEHTVPGAGHSIVWDAPEAVAAHLHGFMAPEAAK